jgi:hypothetical protein
MRCTEDYRARAAIGLQTKLTEYRDWLTMDDEADERNEELPAYESSSLH